MKFVFILLTLFLSIQSFSAEVSRELLFVSEITDIEQFRSLALPSKGVLRQGKTIKFLIDKRNEENPEVFFLNAGYCTSSRCGSPKKISTYHFNFAEEVIERFEYRGKKSLFNENFYYTTELDERNYIGGRIQETVISKDGVDKSILGVRFIERDLISEEMISYTMAAIKKVYSANAELAFVINSQNHTVERVRDWFVENSIGLYTIEDLVSNVPYFALNPGVAYGIINYFPEDPEDLEPYEIAVFDEVPLDLAVVAGTITRSFQDVGSHVNLKSKERNTPNMVLRDEDELLSLKELNGRPVKLTVTFDGYTVELLESADKVFEEYEKIISSPWKKPSFIEDHAMVSFDEMCSQQSSRHCLDLASQFGGKASSLGFLAHESVVGMGSDLQKREGYRLSPLGFGVSLSGYRRFVKHNYNGIFREKLDELLLTEMGLEGRSPLPSKSKRALTNEVRDLFLSAELPLDLYEEILLNVNQLKSQVSVQYPGVELKKIKIRSSANTEDIDGFNGAGLHDSFSAKLKDSGENTANCSVIEKLDEETGLLEEKVSPKSLSCAVKAVYASLWSLRAVRERSYRRFDHRFAQMGLAIQPVYKFRSGIKISANSVLITRVIGAASVYGQQMSNQVGNGLVTNPTPNTRSELLNVTFQSNETNFGINLIQYAKPKAEAPPLTDTVLNRTQTLFTSELGRTVEKAYCRAKNDTYFPGRNCKYITNSVKKPSALDMEFKHFDNGETLIKQVRTFSGK